MGSTIQLIQNLIGTPNNTAQILDVNGVSHIVTVYDTQYIAAAIFMLIVLKAIMQILNNAFKVIMNRGGKDD